MLTQPILEQLLHQYGTMREIGRHIGMHHSDVGKWMDKFNIPRLKRKDSVHLKKLVHSPIPETLHPFLDGMIAGDGNLRLSQSHTSAQFRLGSPKLGFIEAVGKLLKEANLHVHYGKQPNYVSVETQSLVSLLPYYHRWYKNNKKYLPMDVSNSPEMWRWLYTSDGCLLKIATWSYVIHIATNCFSEEENLRFCQMLNVHGIRAAVRKNKIYYFLYIGAREVEPFLSFIGDSPCPDLNYRWLRDYAPIRQCRCCSQDFIPNRNDMIFCNKKCAVYYNQPRVKLAREEELTRKINEN